MENREQTERIKAMESRYDRALKVVQALDKAVSNYSKFRPELEKLIEYYDSGLWRRDFEDDGQGLIPEDLKRGVLSEDGVFDLLADITAVEQEIRELKF